MLAGIFEVKGVACQEDEVAVEILGNGRAVARRELIEQLAVVRRDPARELKLRRAPTNFQPIFVREPCFKDIELQWANNAYQSRRSVGRLEYLRDAFLGQLVRRLLELLGPHGIGQTNPAQNLRREVRYADKVAFLA